MTDNKAKDIGAREFGKFMLWGTLFIGGFALFLRLVAMRRQ